MYGKARDSLKSHSKNLNGDSQMITLTDKAAVKVKQLLESENATELALRVAVRPGGCSGYSYEMFFDGEFAADDLALGFGFTDAGQMTEELLSRINPDNLGMQLTDKHVHDHVALI